MPHQKRASILFNSIDINAPVEGFYRPSRTSVHLKSGIASPMLGTRKEVPISPERSPSPFASARALPSSKRMSRALRLSLDLTADALEDESPTTPSLSRLPHSPSHSRRKTYGGDLNAAMRDVVLGYEERIALLEARNARISTELEVARDALAGERQERNIERQSAVLSSANAPTALDVHRTEQSDLLFERKLRMEVLDALKKVRTQNSVLSRKASEYQQKCDTLSSVLEAERIQKKDLEEELTQMSQSRFTLLEHNKLLASRDAALQEDIATLLTKSKADDWMREVLQAELERARKGLPPSDPDSPLLSPDGPAPLHLTLEDEGPLRAQLITAYDELHIANIRLVESERKCEDLNKRISSLQKNMDLCVDSSAHALEVERDLRKEMEQKLLELQSENKQLKQHLAAQQCAESPLTPLTDNAHAVAISPTMNEVVLRRPPFRGLKKSPQSARFSLNISRLSTPTRPDFVFPLRTPMSPDTPGTETSATLISSPMAHRTMGSISSAHGSRLDRWPSLDATTLFECTGQNDTSPLTSVSIARKTSPSAPFHNGRGAGGGSALLSLSLSMKTAVSFAEQPNLKSVSTIYVDRSTSQDTHEKSNATSSPRDPIIQASSKFVKIPWPARNPRRRASAVLADIAHTYTEHGLSRTEERHV